LPPFDHELRRLLLTFSTFVRRYSQAVKYPVALVPTEKGFSVSCPGLPGCWPQGATEAEAPANIQDASIEYLTVARQLAGEQFLREVEIPTESRA